MFLGILVLVAALLVVYFESKMREQNHKMASMLSLITCIAEEMNDIKSQPRVGGSYPIQPFNSNLETSNINNINNTHIITTDLIQVSDDSDSSSEDSDSDSDNDSQDNDSQDSDSENDSVKEVIEIGEQSDIKVFKLNISSMNNIDENNNVDDLDELDALNNLDNLDNLDDLDDLDEDHFSDDSVSVDSNEEKNDTEEQKNEEINILDLNLKSINISNLEEVKNSNNIDYKKFTLSKLRSTVVEKGLIDDSSKLKKNELLKLLGCSNE
jgi:hypothetical protein